MQRFKIRTDKHKLQKQIDVGTASTNGNTRKSEPFASKSTHSCFLTRMHTPIHTGLLFAKPHDLCHKSSQKIDTEALRISSFWDTYARVG